jgi:hypothetical protein
MRQVAGKRTAVLTGILSLATFLLFSYGIRSRLIENWNSYWTYQEELGARQKIRRIPELRQWPKGLILKQVVEGGEILPTVPNE